MNLAYELILAERNRQITALGYAPHHDNQYVNHELEKAADCYATHPSSRALMQESTIPIDWPWDPIWWKPGDRNRELVKAGALYLAQKDLLVRKGEIIPQILRIKLDAVEQELQKRLAPAQLSGRIYKYLKNYLVNELGFGRLAVENLFYQHLRHILTQLVERELESAWMQRVIKKAVFDYLEIPSVASQWGYDGRQSIKFSTYVDKLAKEVVREEIVKRVDFDAIQLKSVNES
ncbi:hypothetical protein GCM10028806_33590 [Spirosoma terrae]|uniref:hypothetical protein n=1 Tax=Spirosoma terrae TaxID=1968276 RepID=UPI001BAE8811|nr:hypothetical protein [Spirosoma terrae]